MIKLTFFLLQRCICLALTLFSIVLLACTKEESLLPSVKTIRIFDILDEEARCDFRVINEGGAPVTEMGICWSLMKNPTMPITSENSEYSCNYSCYTSILTSLIPEKTYYVRAYAVNSFGTGYGEELTFNTIRIRPPSSVTTKPVKVTSSFGAIAGGYMTDAGGLTSFECGFCCNTEPNPDTTFFYQGYITDYTGSFKSIISGLLPNTTYYLRAYERNESGGTYGNQVTFTTDPSISDVEGKIYPTTIIGSQIWMAENLTTSKYNDGTPIPLIEEQSVWNTSTEPGFSWFATLIYNPLNVYPDYKLDALYNWHAVSSGKLCPVGWHVPSIKEWQVLFDYLGHDGCVRIHTIDPNYLYENVYDYTLFGAIATGYRDTITAFTGFPIDPCESGPMSPCPPASLYYMLEWWSSTDSGNSTAWSMLAMCREEVKISKKYGFPVRCVKN